MLTFEHSITSTMLPAMIFNRPSNEIVRLQHQLHGSYYPAGLVQYKLYYVV